MANKRKFVKYKPPENAAFLLTVQVEAEPDGDYSIVSANAQERRGDKTAQVEIPKERFSETLRRLKIDEAEVRIAIEEALEQQDGGVL